MAAIAINDILMHTFTIIKGTTSATIGMETTHAHNALTVPWLYMILPQSAGVVYESKSPDQTNLYIKGTVASLNFTAIVLI